MGGWGWLGIAKIKPTQPQLGLAGAWAELGKTGFIQDQNRKSSALEDFKNKFKRLGIC